MDVEERFNLMFETYKNQTKMSIIFLLVEHEKMTVTEMSKYMEVSRSNLYQTVSQLVSDKILLKPEVIPKKNYVEKFYSLNPEFFASVDWAEFESQLSTMSADETRAVLKASLASQTFNLAMLTEKLSHATDDSVLKIRDAWAKQEAIILYSLHHRQNYPGVEGNLKKIVEELQKKPEKELTEEGPVIRLMILALPYI